MKTINQILGGSVILYMNLTMLEWVNVSSHGVYV